MRHPGVSLVLLLVLTAAPVAAQGDQEIRSGSWRRSDHVPEGWVVFETRNYQIQSQAGQDKAERLGRHLELMFELYRRTFPSRRQGGRRFAVKLFRDRRSFVRYGGVPMAAAYYNRMGREIVAYDTGRWTDEEEVAEEKAPAESEAKEGEGRTGAEPSIEEVYERFRRDYSMDVLGVIAHEAWHQYFQEMIVVSLVDLPSWLDEGVADYFYTARPRMRGGRLETAELGGTNPGRLLVCQLAIKRGRTTTFESILRQRRGEFYGYASVNYAQAWAMVHFLMHHEDPRYRMIVPTLVRRFQSSKNMDRNTEEAFRGIDLAELEEEWKEYVLSLRP